MSKELPYFKFYPSEWLMGDITLESFEVQGVFVNVVSYYWQRHCDITLGWLKQRLNGAEASLKQLVKQGILKHDMTSDKVTINFTDEQWVELSDLHTILSESGKKGGEAKRKQRLSQANATLKHIDKEEDKEKKKIKKKDLPFDFDWEFEKSKFLGDTKWQEDYIRKKGGNQVMLLERMELFVSDIELQDDFKTCKELRSHFVNKDKIQKNNTKSDNGAIKHFEQPAERI